MITPKDIHGKKFATKLNGYSGAQVDLFLDQVAETIETLSQQNAELKADIKKANEQLEQMRALENTLRDTMVTAQKAANEVTADARIQAQQIIASAQAQATVILRQAEKDSMDAEASARCVKEQIGQYARLVRQVMAGQLDLMEQHFSRLEDGHEGVGVTQEER